MKVFELREKTRQELIDLLSDLHKEKFNLSLRRGAQELPNPLRMRSLRRDIACIKTVLKEDELGIKKLLEPRKAKTQVKGKSEKEKDKSKEARGKNEKSKGKSENSKGTSKKMKAQKGA